jgi:hypothetical protein
MANSAIHRDGDREDGFTLSELIQSAWVSAQADSMRRPPRSGRYSDHARVEASNAVKARLILGTLLAAGEEVFVDVLAPAARFPNATPQERQQLAARLARTALNDSRPEDRRIPSTNGSFLRLSAPALGIVQDAVLNNPAGNGNRSIEACRQSITLLDGVLQGTHEVPNFDSALRSLHDDSEFADASLEMAIDELGTDGGRPDELGARSMQIMATDWNRYVSGELVDEFREVGIMDELLDTERDRLRRRAVIEVDRFTIAAVANVLFAHGNLDRVLAQADIERLDADGEPVGVVGAAADFLDVVITTSGRTATGKTHEHEAKLDALTTALVENVTGGSLSEEDLSPAGIVQQLAQSRDELIGQIDDALAHGRHHEVTNIASTLRKTTRPLRRSLRDMKPDVEQLTWTFEQPEPLPEPPYGEPRWRRALRKIGPPPVLTVAADSRSQLEDRGQMTVNALSRNRGIQQLMPEFAAVITDVAWTRSDISIEDPAAATTRRESWDEVPQVDADLSMEPFRGPVERARARVEARVERLKERARTVRKWTKVTTAVGGGVAAVVAAAGAMIAPAGQPGQVIVLPNNVRPPAVDEQETPPTVIPTTPGGKVKIPVQKPTTAEPQRGEPRDAERRDSGERKSATTSGGEARKKSDHDKPRARPDNTAAPAPGNTVQPTKPTKPPVAQPEKPKPEPEQPKPEEPKPQEPEPREPEPEPEEPEQPKPEEPEQPAPEPEEPQLQTADPVAPIGRSDAEEVEPQNNNRGARERAVVVAVAQPLETVAQERSTKTVAVDKTTTDPQIDFALW